MNQKPFREERLQRIAELVRERRKVRVNELAKEFNVSPSSIRMDLAELESLGLLKRTHGGAIPADALPEQLVIQKPPLELRQITYQDEKMAISQAAATLIEDGDTLMIDGGSTTIHVARPLSNKRGLTIITTAISLLPHLMAIPDSQIYVVGGLLDPKFETLIGDITIDMLERFRTSKAILGIDGVSVSVGLSVTNSAVAKSKQSMMRLSEQVIIVADHTKLAQVALFPIAPLSECDYLVTSSLAPPEVVAAIERTGTRVLIAPVQANPNDDR